MGCLAVIQILGRLIPIGEKSPAYLGSVCIIEETAYPSEMKMITCEQVEKGHEKMVIGF